MFVLIFIFITFLITTTLTAPPPARLHTPVTCGGKLTQNRPPVPDDCISLLHIIQNLPWVKEETTFGHRNIPPRGAVPRFETAGTCEFELDVRSESSTATETFKLFQYFPAIYQIIGECFEHEHSFPEGTVGVGQGNKFTVTLSGPLLSTSARNRTVPWSDSDLMIAGKKTIIT